MQVLDVLHNSSSKLGSWEVERGNILWVRLVVLEVPVQGFGVEFLGLLRINNVDPKFLKRDQRIQTTINISCRNQEPAESAISGFPRHDDGPD